MKSKYSDKLNFPLFELEEEDLRHARKIKGMMQSEGWKILINYLAVSRETIIERLKQLPKTDAEIRRTALIGAVLHGFDESVALPERIVKRAEEQLKIQEEANNADPHINEFEES